MSKKSVQKKVVPFNKEYLVSSLGEWEKVTHDLARELQVGDMVTLSGPLGAGKTTFVQALAAALGADHTPKSPTFSLVRTYRLRSTIYRLRSLVHVDAYRIERDEDVRTLGLDELQAMPGTIMAIEWPENISHWLQHQKDLFAVSIKLQKDGTRIVRVKGKRS